jgi:hypothetical protein
MSIQKTLDSIHSRMTSNRLLQIFTSFTRCLLAVGFIPPSIPKILHKPFTVLPDTNPVGHYFAALYDTGFYYEFIGWGQITAALLLLFPRTAHIGALMFLPIIANIAVLTWSVGFQGTWLLTIFMLLAALWLTAWEYDRLKPIVFFDRENRAKPFKYQFLAVPIFFAVGGAVMAVLWWMIGLGNFSNYVSIGFGLAALGVAFGIVVSLHYRFMPTGKLRETSVELE